MAENIHIVPHFHWDREWYFTAEESKILLVRDMEEILEMLETNPNYPFFVLDGQTVVLEDYFSVKPENKQRVKRLVQDGKLIIGPWYTQTDEMVVGGESIVRNLLYGKLDCEEFGDIMQIGYLPDSFGQSARIPQILNGFGITRCTFWRGVSERKGTDKTEFYWTDGNSKVIVQLMPLGYAIGKYLPVNHDELKSRLDKYLSVLDKCATTEHILIPNGHDQMPIQKNIFEVMKQIESCYPERNVYLSRYENIFEEIEKAKNLETIIGEFLDGKYMRVHRSIFSTRADIKSANTRIENKITNILEPLMSIAYKLGFAYEHGLVEEIWKEIMKNHAHDSIGCCCSDKVHKIIADRFFIAEERTDRLIDFYKRIITDAMPCDRALDKLVLFNLLAYERTEVSIVSIITKMTGFKLTDENNNVLPYKLIKSEVVDAGLIDRQIVHYGDYDPFVRYTIAIEDTLPACGYKTYFITKDSPIQDKKAFKDTDTLENEYYQITVLQNGTLVVLDKKTGVTYNNVLLLEDGSDDGDEYDYSPLEDDYIITSENIKAETTIHDYDYYSTANINYTLPVPKDLDSRQKHICNGLISLEIDIILKKGSQIIELNIAVDNQAKDHRLRMLFPNNLKSDFSVSDNQFGSIKRPIIDEAIAVWEQDKWTERPDSIYPFLSYVHCGTNQGLTVITNSVREYEITDSNAIAITLFRSVGLLGKENLYRRPGRPSGIKLETPDSQLLGKMTYSLAFAANTLDAPELAKRFLTPTVFYNKMPFNAMKLNSWDFETPYEFSLITLSNKGIITSAIKKAEKSDTLVIRCFNPYDNPMTGKFSVDKVELLKLDESIINVDEEGSIYLAPNEIKTFGFR